MAQGERWKCDVCGPTNDVALYQTNLRKPGFLIAPVLPTCNACRCEVRLVGRGAPGPTRRVLLITGPVGSGKTTLAEYLFQEHGFHAIDHDCLIDLAQHRHGRKIEFNDPEVMEALEDNLDLLLGLGSDVVMSLVILPAELDTYRAMLLDRRVNYRIFFLTPDYETVLARTRSRKYFRNVIPEKWVRHFYDETKPFREMETEDVVLVDNTEMGVEETVRTVLASFA